MAIANFFARQSSPQAAADALVVTNDPTAQLTFTNDDPNSPGIDENGDLSLDYNNGLPDPDTMVAVNGGAPQTFTYTVIGALPAAGVPPALVGKLVAKIVLADGRIFFFVLDGTGTLELMELIGNGNMRLIGADTTPDPTPICFCTGTEILTPSGPRRVEDLRAGDMVTTADGAARPLVWVGRTEVSADSLRAQPNLRPIRISAGAFGPGLPAADLFVSPQHRIVLDGPEAALLIGAERVLVAAKHLVGTLAEVTEPEAAVSYFHLLLEDHQILVSNGLPTESFQPAQRTVETMSGDSRTALDAVIAALGEAAMLSRKDALPSLKRAEARLLAQAVARRFSAIPAAAHQGVSAAA